MPTRRSLLALAAAGLAGCQSTSDKRLSSPSFPALEGDRPSFRRWLPAIPATEAATWYAVNLDRLAELQPTLTATGFDSLTGLVTTDYFGRSVAELESAIWLPTTTGPVSLALVYPGSFDVDAVEDALTAGRYERYDSDASARFYRLPGTDRVAAASAEAVVMGSLDTSQTDPERGFVTFTQEVFAAGAGLAPRLHNRSASFERYTDTVGWPLVTTGFSSAHVVFSEPGPPAALEGERVAGSAFVRGAIRGDRLWFTADDPSAVADALRRAVGNGRVSGIGGSLPAAPSAVRTHESAVELAVSQRRDDGPTGTYPPMATLDATLDEETVTVSHLAGEPVAIERLSVLVGGESHRFGRGQLTPGDSVSVTLSEEVPSYTNVVLSTPSGDTSRVLSLDSAEGT